MTTQPDLIQPLEIDVAGADLADTIHELQRDGALITAIDRGPTNGSWRLPLHWPQPEGKP